MVPGPAREAAVRALGDLQEEDFLMSPFTGPVRTMRGRVAPPNARRAVQGLAYLSGERDPIGKLNGLRHHAYGPGMEDEIDKAIPHAYKLIMESMASGG